MPEQKPQYDNPLDAIKAAKGTIHSFDAMLDFIAETFLPREQQAWREEQAAIAERHAQGIR